MTKNKKNYAAPVMQMQVFVPNAYMKQCLAGQSFGVKCVVSGKDIVQKDGVTHGANGCGSSSSQSLSFNSSTNMWTFTETSTSGNDLGTMILSDAVSSLDKDKLDYSTLEQSYQVSSISYSDIYKYQTSYLYWVTYRPYDKTIIWHHKGYLVDLKKTEKNLS